MRPLGKREPRGGNRGWKGKSLGGDAGPVRMHPTGDRMTDTLADYAARGTAILPHPWNLLALAVIATLAALLLAVAAVSGGTYYYYTSDDDTGDAGGLALIAPGSPVSIATRSA